MTVPAAPVPVITRVDYTDPRHGADLLMLLDGYARDPMGGGKPLGDHSRAHLMAALAACPGAFSLLAYVDDHPAGLANCFTGLSTFAARPVVNIHDMATHADYRGRGIATMLFAEVERIARAAGACKVTLEVLTGNVPARRLYRQWGFGGYGLDDSMGTAEFWEKALT